MKINVGIEMSNEELNHLANLIDGKFTKRTATRKEVTAFVMASVARLANLSPEYNGGNVETVSNAVVSDINRGGWTLIGEPPGAFK